MGTTYKESLRRNLEKAPTETLELIKVAMEREPSVCVGEWVETAPGKDQPVGCLLAGAVWHSPAFMRAKDKKQFVDEFDVDTFLGLDDEFVTDLVGAFDKWGSVKGNHEVIEFTTLEDEGTPYELEFTSEIKLLTPAAQREVAEMVGAILEARKVTA